MSLRHAILGLLGNKPASGYDIVKVFERSLVNVWPANQSQVYGELARLAKEELVEVSAEGPRGRKEYTITEAGQAEMRHWLIETEPIVLRRSDMLLRAFFLNQVEPESAEAYLRRQAEVAAAEHEKMVGLREKMPEYGEGPLTSNGLLALEWGVRLFAMQREWAEWAVKRID